MPTPLNLQADRHSPSLSRSPQPSIPVYQRHLDSAATRLDKCGCRNGAGPDYVGACIDSGNPVWMAESPFVTLHHLAPYVLMSHIRDSAVWPHPQGAVAQWVAMGEGTIGIDQWAKLYQEKCPNTNFTLEIITSLAPKVLDYLTPEYWSVYPDYAAAEFAQFLRLVSQGKPYTQPILTADWGNIGPEVKAALAFESRAQLEKSVKYCREVLKIGP